MSTVTSTDSQYFTTGVPSSVAPGSTKIVANFLAKPNQASTEAWLLATGGLNANGALHVRLINDYGQALSDYAEVHSSRVERVKFVNVKIPVDAFPPVVRVEAKNTSSTDHSDAFVHGVLVVY